MNEAFTVRLRVSGGRHALWTAPAGGMGLSSPCCETGHDSVTDATAHGLELLSTRLAPPNIVTSSAA